MKGLYDTTRILPNNVDDLRSKNNQKTQYKQPLIYGLNYEKSPIVAIESKKRNEKYFDMTLDRTIVTLPVNSTELRGNYKIYDGQKDNVQTYIPSISSDVKKFQIETAGSVKESSK